MDSIWQFGIQMIHALQGWGEWTIPIMKFFSALGYEDFYLLILPVLYWTVDASTGVMVAVMLIFSKTTNDFFKLLFSAPRPYWYSTAVKAFSAETSFGVPSGHAQNAVVIWGSLAYRFKRRWAWAVAIFLMVMIGISRLFLGVHFPTDLLVGWLIGGLLLWGMIKFWNQLTVWAKGLDFNVQLLVGLAVSLGMIGLVALPYIFLRDWTIPQLWLDNATAAGVDALPDPVTLSGAVTMAGVFFGLIVGLVWMHPRGGFDAGGLLWKRAARYLIGVIGVAIFYIGLGEIFPKGEALLPFILRFIRYFLVGFWIFGLSPALFIRFNLAEPAKKHVRKKKHS